MSKKIFTILHSKMLFILTCVAYTIIDVDEDLDQNLDL